jgi:hypothetical protein
MEIPWPVPPLPEFGLPDLYKLIYQAWLGPGHAIPSRDGASAYLRLEWSALGRAGPEHDDIHKPPVIEVLSEGAPFVRVHLRPYRDAGGSMEELLEAFLRSASVPPDPEGFARDWARVRELVVAGALALTQAEYELFDRTARSAGYPALHHSRVYQVRARLAYRVVAKGEAGRVQPAQ